MVRRRCSPSFRFLLSDSRGFRHSQVSYLLRLFARCPFYPRRNFDNSARHHSVDRLVGEVFFGPPRGAEREGNTAAAPTTALSGEERIGGLSRGLGTGSVGPNKRRSIVGPWSTGRNIPFEILATIARGLVATAGSGHKVAVV